MACCIHVVAQLSIADILLKGPKTLAELAAEAQSDAKSLSRLLRAVTSVGIFTEKEDGTFELNDFGATLLSDVPGSVKPWALANMGEHYPAFGALTYGVQTGKVPFEHAHGKPVWEYYKDNPVRGANLAKAMAGMSAAVLKTIIDAYDFNPYKKMVELLIIDSVIPDDSRNRPHAGKLLDINILAMTTGQERTLSEFKTIIERAGLKFNRLIETETEISSIIECGRY